MIRPLADTPCAAHLARVLLLYLLGLAGQATGGAPAPAEPGRLLARFCVDCHGDEQPPAGLNLKRLAADRSFATDFRVWRKLLEQLDQRRMPPRDATQPSDAERRRLVASIRGGLDRAIERHAGDPGQIVMRRLTSAEYAYTVHDLTGLDLDIHRRFTTDAVGGAGFTNSGATQFVQDSTFEEYLQAARQIARHAVIGAGRLGFYGDPGASGFELSAITRIQTIYRTHGFRTAAGEGGEAFGMDNYPRVFFAAWLWTHRERLGRGSATPAELAAEERLDAPFLEYMHRVLTEGDHRFPTSEIIALWQRLPVPGDDADQRPNGPLLTSVRQQCRQIAARVHHWQTRFGSNADAKEEAPVLRADLFAVKRSQPFVMNVNWPSGTKRAHLVITIESALPDGRPDAVVIWKKPRIQFLVADQRAEDPRPLRTALAASVAQRLDFGNHPRGGDVGREDFVTSGTVPTAFELPIPPDARSARFQVEAELDIERGEDCIVRCAIAQLEETDQGKSVSGLLANSGSPAFVTWKQGVLEFARLLPQVSQREPAPSDRDPIPPPFDATYNNPQRNAFHTRIKYHRDDRFLVEHILDGPLRMRLDQAWVDLRSSFGYHDAWLLMLVEAYRFPLGDRRMVDIQPAWIEELPPQVRRFLIPLHREYLADREALQAAQRGHLADALALAERAWRRPLHESESQRLIAFYDALRERQRLDHPSALRALITRILVSPDFLFRAERVAADDRSSPLSDRELATRLSYLLWSSVPDEPLRRAAASGALRDPDALARHARRMLADPKAKRFATEFFGQWFGFYRFDGHRGIDPQRFPEFTDSLKAAMYQEAVGLCTHIVRHNRPLSEILFANYTFLNAELASHYGIALPVEDSASSTHRSLHPQPTDIRQVNDVQRFHRGGLLRLGAVLAVTSAPLRTSPVRRGDWILRQVLGQAVPPPPADAGSIPADDVRPDGLSVRQRLAAHRQDAACVNCHSRIDPFGFALERYDPLGRWRDHYRDGQPIDTSGILRDGTPISGDATLHTYLQAQQPRFHATLARKFLGYALGRPDSIGDAPLLKRMAARLAAGCGMAELAECIVTSRQFRYHATVARAPADRSPASPSPP